jgi:hypothetical protein
VFVAVAAYEILGGRSPPMTPAEGVIFRGCDGFGGWGVMGLVDGV